jgi:hypothetical protein
MQPIEMQNHGAEPSVAALDEQILEHGVRETCELVTREPDDVVARALAELSPALAVRVLQRLRTSGGETKAIRKARSDGS